MRAEDVERLFDEYAEPLFAYLAYRTGSRVEAEDLVGETFERVLRKRRRFTRRRGTEKAWLFSIASNLAVDAGRRVGAEERALVRAGPPDEETQDFRDGVEAREDVMSAVAQLTDAEREVIALRFGADLTVPEIARLTGEKLTTVEGRLYRAQAALRGLVSR